MGSASGRIESAGISETRAVSGGKVYQHDPAVEMELLMGKRFISNRLAVTEGEVTLEAPIRDVIALGDRQIVLFADEKYEKGDPNAVRNIVAVDDRGEIIWRVESSGPVTNTPNDPDTPFVGWEWKTIDGKKKLVVYEMIGMCYELDTNTGKLSNPKISK